MRTFNYNNYKNYRIEEVEKNPDKNFYYIMWNREIRWLSIDNNILPISDYVIKLIKNNKNLRVIFINEQEAENKNSLIQLEKILKIYDIDPKQFWLISNSSKMLDHKNELNSEINIHITRATGYALKQHMIDLDFITKKENIFLCHNRSPKSHRYGVLCLLKKYNIIDYTDWSMINHSDNVRYFEVFTDYDINLLQTEINYFNQIKRQKSKYETEYDWFDDENNIKWGEIYNKKTFENSYFNIVTETFFDSPEIHITEKSFKPFCAYQFPLILASKHHIKKFKEIYDFDFFDDVINHDYDNISNHRDRLFKFVEEVKRIQENKDFFITFYNNNQKRFEENFNKMKNMNLNYDHDFFDSLINWQIEKTIIQPTTTIEPTTIESSTAIKLKNQQFINKEPDIEITLDSGIHLIYPSQLDGGGSSARFDFIDILQKDLKKKYKHAYEWCSGFGIIGFDMLGNNICENIHFSDILPLAIENCLYNAKNNNVSDKVFGYISDNVKSLPVEHLFDLVVGNGPCNFNLEEYTKSRLEYENKTSTNEILKWNIDVRMGVDDNCKIHIEFFDNITSKITEDADILLIVNNNRTDKLMSAATKNGFELIHRYPTIHFCGGGEIYHFKLKQNYE